MAAVLNPGRTKGSRNGRLLPLENGDRLDSAEFLKRYQAMAWIKKAELIEGIMSSRVFPGLWLHLPSLLAMRSASVIARLQKGLKTASHRSFVAGFAKLKR